MPHRIVFWLVAAVLPLYTPWLYGQGSQPPQPGSPSTDTSPSTWTDSLQAVDKGKGDANAQAEGHVEWRSWFALQQGETTGRLHVEAVIEPNWYIYSTTQPKGGPRRTVIEVASGSEFELTGDFQADRDPKIGSDPVFPDVSMETLAGEIVWTAPIRIAEDVNPGTLRIPVSINGQACAKSGACELISNKSIQAQFQGTYEVEAWSRQFEGPEGHATITGHVEPQAVAPGESFQLVLTAELKDPWHIYGYAAADPNQISKPTLIALRKVHGWNYETAEPSTLPREEKTGLEQEPVMYYHDGTVSWTTPIHVPSNAESGEYQITGGIGFQTCTPTSCDIPSGANFRFTVNVGDRVVQGRTPVTFQAGTYAEVARDAERALSNKRELAAKQGETKQGSGFNPVSGSADGTDQSVIVVLSLAFLGGLILNVMPCVLPVIGLKIMSFVHQSGGSHREILSLNLWFSLGLMSVFWALGAAAAFAGHAWGSHFGNAGFLITMIGIVFAFGLSFLGVWEIPIPGFVSTGAVQGAAEREGVTGAFSKGVLSTILATPCAGPLIAPTVGWAIKQPAGLTLSTFTFIGLGMAAPYLLIGAIPQLVNALPKPGPWMDTFKQSMGFLLMGTVVFLFLSVPGAYVTPTLAVLWAIGLACWLVGRTPITVSPKVKSLTWTASLTLITVIATVGFTGFSVFGSSSAHDIDWRPFSREAVQAEIEAGNTVMVDFTADWCATCKYNETVILNSAAVKKQVAQNRVVTFKADKTRESPEIDAFMAELGNVGSVIPFLAIFPSDGDRPITFDGPIRQKSLLEAIKQAGPSPETP